MEIIQSFWRWEILVTYFYVWSVVVMDQAFVLHVNKTAANPKITKLSC
jgi:hypothetical protein